MDRRNFLRLAGKTALVGGSVATGAATLAATPKALESDRIEFVRDDTPSAMGRTINKAIRVKIGENEYYLAGADADPDW